MGKAGRPLYLEQTFHAADQILRQNLYPVILNGVEYRRTVPSRQFYVHQWNWDSATVAMGLVHVDPTRAFDELRALISGQWENGLIAQITYNPREMSYYPQAEKWRTASHCRNGIVTSGITQPPVLAIAVDYIRRHAPETDAAKRFLAELIPATRSYHEYLKRYRDPEDGGLLTVVHPWESGTDNSPRWDSSYAHIDLDAIPDAVKEDVRANRTDVKAGEAAHRPTDEDYVRFMGLVHQFADLDWDYERIVAASPFAVKDILLSSIWARANEALADTLTQQGDEAAAARYRAWAAQTKEALRHTWLEQHRQYCDIDVANGRHDLIVEPTNAMFAPLYAGAVDADQLPHLLARLADPAEFWPTYPVPTTALNSPKREAARYWRGPTWPITNLFIIEGLRRYAEQNEQARHMADDLVDRTLGMIAKHGFFEYFDPTRGAARPGRTEPEAQLGFGNFSWTAAIYLKLFADHRQPGSP